MFSLIPLIQVALAITIVILYLRGDRARHLRRCPTCWYDMGQVPGMTCPECSFVAPNEPALHAVRRQRINLVAASLLLVIAIWLFTASAIRRGVLGSLPRPVVALVLEQSVPQTPRPVGASIPSVLLAARGPNEWSRLRWNQEYVHAIRDWADLVASDAAPTLLANVGRVHAALNTMDAWRDEFHRTFWNESWIVTDEVERQRRRIAELGDQRTITLPLADGQTVRVDRSELFMLCFQPPTAPPPYARTTRIYRAPDNALATGVMNYRFGYVRPPQAYLAALAGSTSVTARQYALERLAPEPSREVDIDVLLARVETDDPDPMIRSLAESIRRTRSRTPPPP